MRPYLVRGSTAIASVLVGVRSASSSAPPPLQLLNGGPLEQPHIYSKSLNWKHGDIFTSLDDPDRTRGAEGEASECWSPPPFLAPTESGTSNTVPAANDKVTSFDVSKIKGFIEGTSFARAVDGILSEQECAQLLTSVNRKGFTPALVNIGGNMQRYLPRIRDGLRVVQDVPNLSKLLFHRLEPHLPPTMDLTVTSMQGLKSMVPRPWYQDVKLHALNDRCRFLCYKPGQFFKAHRDGNQEHGGCVSAVTVQLYLHDVDVSFGGGTAFISSEEAAAGGGFTYQPKAGSVLLFSQELVHEGVQLKAGGIKYAMRTEAMYTDAA